MEIAIIAHDGKKADMVQFLNQYKSKLQEKKITIVSTGTTGNKVEKAGKEVTKLLSGPLGGDAQIGARIAEGKCKMVIFFRDPLEKHPHETDVLMLMRLCDVHDVPFSNKSCDSRIAYKSIVAT